jgi:hypothetical protein
VLEGHIHANLFWQLELLLKVWRIDVSLFLSEISKNETSSADSSAI